jgi:hypothetical protein
MKLVPPGAQHRSATAQRVLEVILAIVNVLCNDEKSGHGKIYVLCLKKEKRPRQIYDSNASRTF